MPSPQPLGRASGAGMLPAEPSWRGRARAAVSCSVCDGEPSHHVPNALPPFSCTIVFTSDFFMCFSDLPEALNLPSASLPSNRKMGCGKFFFFFILD